MTFSSRVQIGRVDLNSVARKQCCHALCSVYQVLCCLYIQCYETGFVRTAKEEMFFSVHISGILDRVQGAVFKRTLLSLNVTLPLTPDNMSLTFQVAS